MANIRTLISSFGAIERGFRADGLKLCFLWYDEVMFEAVRHGDEDAELTRLVNGDNLSRSELHAISDVIVPVTRRISKDLAKKITAMDIRGFPRWGENYENYTYPSPQTPEQYAHNQLLRKIKRERGTIEDIGVEHAEGRARVAVDAVSLWRDVNLEVPCMLQANNDEKSAMEAVCLFNAPPTTNIVPYKLFEISIPSLEHVPWSEIVRIKRQGNFGSMRESLHRIVESSNEDLELARKLLADAEKIATSEIIDRYRPNIKSALAEALWSNIPNIPFVNPIGVYFGAKNVHAENRKKQTFDWYYLLRDIRTAANMHECDA